MFIAVGTNVVTNVNNLAVTPNALNSSLAFIFAHATSTNPTEAKLLREFNQHISMTPESEMHYGHGHVHTYLVRAQE
jgi:hypothetical protein